MYKEQNYDQRPAPAIRLGPAPRVSLEHIGPDLWQRRDAAAQSLAGILRRLDELSVKIAYHSTLHCSRNTQQPTESAADEAALEWMQTSLEDIAATLNGMSTDPSRKG